MYTSDQITPVPTPSTSLEALPLHKIFNNDEKRNEMIRLLENYRDKKCNGVLPEFLALFLQMFKVKMLDRPFDLNYTPDNNLKKNLQQKILATAENFLTEVMQKYASLEQLCQYDNITVGDAKKIFADSPAIKALGDKGEFQNFFEWCETQGNNVIDKNLQKNILDNLQQAFIFKVSGVFIHKQSNPEAIFHTFANCIGISFRKKNPENAIISYVLEKINKKKEALEDHFSGKTKLVNEADLLSNVETFLNALRNDSHFVMLGQEHLKSIINELISKLAADQSNISVDMFQQIQVKIREFQSDIKDRQLKIDITSIKAGIESYRNQSESVNSSKKKDLSYPTGFNIYLKPIREEFKKTGAFKALQAERGAIQTGIIFQTERAKKLNPFMDNIDEQGNSCWAIELLSINHPDFSECNIFKLYNSTNSKAAHIQQLIENGNAELKKIIMDQLEITPENWDAQLKLWQKAYWENTPEYKVAEFVCSNGFHDALHTTAEYQFLKIFIYEHFVDNVKPAENSTPTAEELKLLANVIKLSKPDTLDAKNLFIIINNLSSFEDVLRKKGNKDIADKFHKLYTAAVLKSQEIIKSKLNGKYSPQEKEEIIKNFPKTSEGIDVILNKGSNSPRANTKISSTSDESIGSEASIYFYLNDAFSSLDNNSELIDSLNQLYKSEEFSALINFLRENFKGINLRGKNLTDADINAVSLIKRLIGLEPEYLQSNKKQKGFLLTGDYLALQNFGNLLLRNDQTAVFDRYDLLRKAFMNRATQAIQTAYYTKYGKMPEKTKTKNVIIQYVDQQKIIKTFQHQVPVPAANVKNVNPRSQVTSASRANTSQKLPSNRDTQSFVNEMDDLLAAEGISLNSDVNKDPSPRGTDNDSSPHNADSDSPPRTAFPWGNSPLPPSSYVENQKPSSSAPIVPASQNSSSSSIPQKISAFSSATTSSRQRGVAKEITIGRKTNIPASAISSSSTANTNEIVSSAPSSSSASSISSTSIPSSRPRGVVRTVTDKISQQEKSPRKDTVDNKKDSPEKTSPLAAKPPISDVSLASLEVAAIVTNDSGTSTIPDSSPRHEEKSYDYSLSSKQTFYKPAPTTPSSRQKLDLLTRQLTQPGTPSSPTSSTNTADTAVANAEKHSPPSTASQTKQNPEVMPATPQPQQRFGDTTERVFAPLKARRIIAPVVSTTSNVKNEEEKINQDKPKNPAPGSKPNTPPTMM